MEIPLSKSLSDVQVLLEFLRTDESTVPHHEAQITSLQTLCGMCSEKVVDVLIKIGGLNVIWELCGKTDNPEVCQTCLYALACAVETSDEAKKHLTTKQHFNNIRAILNSDLVPEKTKLCSIYFLLPLLSENALGQQLMLSSGCLHILLRTFIQRVKVITNSENPQSNYELWLLSSKALKQAVALPQNKKNQQECARYIPHTITILHESKGEENIILHSCQVFSAVVANNEYCQDTAFQARAVEVFILLLQSWICEPRKEEIVGNIVTALSTLIGDNCEYRQRFQKLGGVHILLSLLMSESVMACELGIGHLNQALTILAGCAKDSGRCRQALCDGNAASAIVRLMNEVDGDEYFGKVTANLLSFCVEKQTNENCTEESSQTILSCDASEPSPSEVEDEPVTHKSEHSHPDIDEVSNFSRSQVPLRGTAVVKNVSEQNDRVLAILERQQAQIDLLQKLLIEERNLRIGNEERNNASEYNSNIVHDMPNQVSNSTESMHTGPSQTRSFTPSWTKPQPLHRDLPIKTFKSPQTQSNIRSNQHEDWAIPVAVSKEHHNSRLTPKFKDGRLHDISSSSRRFFDTDTEFRKAKETPTSDTPIKTPAKAT